MVEPVDGPPGFVAGFAVQPLAVVVTSRRARTYSAGVSRPVTSTVWATPGVSAQVVQVEVEARAEQICLPWTSRTVNWASDAVPGAARSWMFSWVLWSSAGMLRQREKTPSPVVTRAVGPVSVKSPAGKAGQSPAASVRCSTSAYGPVGFDSLVLETRARNGALPVSPQVPSVRRDGSQRWMPSASTTVTSGWGAGPEMASSAASRAPSGSGRDRQSISPPTENSERCTPSSTGSQPVVAVWSMTRVAASV